MLDAYERVAVGPDDRVLVHGDLGLHNIVMQGDEVAGVFDYDGAAWTDRHHDFRYLTFLWEREEMLEAALAVYEPAVGRKLNRARIELYNAACGASFLASRGDAAADERPAGRTLAEDLGWVHGALARLDTIA
jgi:aminoglycoside phosphotransferase (APT) family kinase protein